MKSASCPRSIVRPRPRFWLALFPLVGAMVSAPAHARGALPDLTVALGEQNTGRGLFVPSAGDGTNHPVNVAGAPARRIPEGGAHYFYVGIQDPAYTQGPVEVYVVVEAFDDQVGRLSLQYDRASDHPNIGSKYTGAAETMVLVGSGRWRRGVFHLPDLRLGHGQNNGADFRMAGPSVAIRRITVTPKRPAGFEKGRSLDAEALKALHVDRPPGMELTFGNDAGPEDAAVFQALSVTSVESYVTWADIEPREGHWDWGKWDRQVKVLQKAGLKWVPFLIAGPAYATPDWFRQGQESHCYRCLEHGRDSMVQSLWGPRLRPRVERFLKAFADHYRDTGAIESVLLGITGIYGESIYPAGPEGGWTAGRTGVYHNHHGWWAGDRLAIAAFRAAMKAQYGPIERINSSWGTHYNDFTDVTTFLPDKAPNDRARADLAEWYQKTMTDWAVFWTSAARKAFPTTPIYLCTGGDGIPMLGADFTAQAAAIAKLGAGVRITNEGSDYTHNFTLTREVATATRHYGTFCGFEPASSVDAGGVVARIYNATASGARQLHDYSPNTFGHGAEALRNFRANARFLVPRRPKVDVAIYLSRETWALDPGAAERIYALARSLRDVADLDFITRQSVRDGHLRNYRTVVLAESPVLEPKSAEALERWARDGGALLAVSRSSAPLGGRLYDNSAWRSRLFSKARPSRELIRPVLDGPAPEHWSLDVGGDHDDAWLRGDWFHRERTGQGKRGPDTTMRWTGARPAVIVPWPTGAAYMLRCRVQVPGPALGASGVRMVLDGRTLGSLSKPGEQVVEFMLPARQPDAVPVARLEFQAATWKPSEHEKGNRDRRELGISVRQIEVVRAGAEAAPAREIGVHFELDPARLAPLARETGKGRTVLLSGPASDLRTVAAVFRSLLPTPIIDGREDHRYATATKTGVLWYDADPHQIREARP